MNTAVRSLGQAVSSGTAPLAELLIVRHVWRTVSWVYYAAMVARPGLRGLEPEASVEARWARGQCAR
jgi:hypothetical protein